MKDSKPSSYVYREWSLRYRRSGESVVLSRHTTQKEAVEAMRKNPNTYVYNETYRFDILPTHLGIQWDFEEDEESKEIFENRD